MREDLSTASRSSDIKGVSKSEELILSLNNDTIHLKFAQIKAQRVKF